MNARIFLFLVCAWFGVTAPARADQITVSVAANFLTTAQDIAAAFSAETGHEVVVVHGSTGKLFAQIKAGAPFDLFLSADTDRPAKLVQAGLVEDGDRRTYAIGKLVLVQGSCDQAVGLDDILGDPGIRLAIADPAIAPYGMAARDVLIARRGNEWQDGLVYGESVGQTFTFVATGNAQAGLVALSQARSFDGTLHVLDVPSEFHRPILQDAVLLKRAAKAPAARAFFQFLGGAFAHRILQDAGYEVPE